MKYCMKKVGPCGSFSNLTLLKFIYLFLEVASLFTLKVGKDPPSCEKGVCKELLSKVKLNDE